MIKIPDQSRQMRSPVFKSNLLNLIYCIKEPKTEYITIMSDNAVDFFKACENGDLEIVEQLYGKIQFQNNKALRTASINGHLEVVKYLVEKGEDFRDHHCMQWSAAYRHFKIVEYLIEKGADCTVNDNHVVQTACCYGDLDFVKYLIGKGADFRAGDDFATKGASDANEFEMVKYLVELGASDHRISEKARTYIRKCGINWSRINHSNDFSRDTNKLFGTFFLGLQRLEETVQIPLAHQAMFEDMLECWKIKDDYELKGNIRV